MGSNLASHNQYHDQIFKDVQQSEDRILESEFFDCTFLNCILVGTVFEKCRFVNCTFLQSNLSLMQVPESAFSSTQFENSKVVGVNWSQGDWSALGLGNIIGFSDCAISHSTFIGLNLAGIHIKNCVAFEVDFREADLSRADFTGTDLSGSIFLSTNLREADLRHARNYTIDPGKNEVITTKFSLPEAMSLLYAMDIELDDGDDV